MEGRVLNPSLEAALKYAAKGFEVFPVQGKRPVTPDGMNSATTVKSTINDWWENRPHWGVAIKIPDWAVIVDIDGARGNAQLKEHGYALPDTLTSKSNRGTHHWYERKSTGGKGLRRVGFLPDVDVLVNGYVVAPPSKHPAGGQYQWINALEINRNVIEIAPGWVESAIWFDQGLKTGINVDDLFNGLPEGQRQTGLHRYACSLSRRRVRLPEAKVLVAQLAKISGWDEGSTDELVERVYKTYSSKDAMQEKEEEIKIYSLADLHAMTIPKTTYLIQKLLPATGYSLITSPPKRGKSLVIANAAYCIATGKPFLGMPVEQSGVLYLDLEASIEEAMERWELMVPGSGGIWPANLHVSFNWPHLENGGLDKIKEFLVDHPHVRLVVIDTLADMWPEEEKGNGNAYHREQRIVRQFSPISRDFGCGFFLVHHDKKGDTKDFIQKASGTYAITGKAKAIWHFERATGESTGVLQVSGKNIPEQEIRMWLDKRNMTWKGMSTISPSIQFDKDGEQ